MELFYTREEHDFREEVRSFLAKAFPADIARMQRSGFPIPRDAEERWQRILDAKGWAVPLWPERFGGPGWTPVQRHIYDVERCLADVPDTNISGIQLVAPVIQRFGSPELQQRYLPRIRRGELYFGQGFSEPQAGSDLAQLQTTAVRDGDHFVINGSKIWTTRAHESDMIFLLARTDKMAKPQAGITMLLAPLDAPGITIQPIVTIDDCHHLNQVFFDDVRVPVEDMVGNANEAWTYTKALLDEEKTYNAHIGLLKRFVPRTYELAASEERRTGRTILTDSFRRRLARLTASVEALEWSVLRTLTDTHEGDRLSAVAPALKIRGSELLLKFSELHLEALGPQVAAAFVELPAGGQALPAEASPHAPGIMAQTMFWRASSIFGGTNDIQRNVIWNTALRGR